MKFTLFREIKYPLGTQCNNTSVTKIALYSLIEKLIYFFTNVVFILADFYAVNVSNMNRILNYLSLSFPKFFLI